MTGARTQYVVIGDGWSEQTRRHACRALLKLVAPDAGRYECDIPFSPDWPPDVLQAASLLRDAARRRATDPAYVQTGVLTNDDPARWSAFVTFAPWALDAGVWSRGSGVLASLADEAESMVFGLTESQRQQGEALLGPDRLITLREHDERRRRARGDRV